jgi:hypothetical protein
MISADMIKRKLIFDAMADPEAAMRLAGLIGMSPDVAEKENEESLRRLEGVIPIAQPVIQMTDWLAEWATQLQINNLESTEVHPAFAAEMQIMYSHVIQGSVMAVLAVLVDLDILQINFPGGE